MSVIVGHTPAGSTETHYMATVKGAPETLKDMVRVDNLDIKGRLGSPKKNCFKLYLSLMSFLCTLPKKTVVKKKLYAVIWENWPK